MQSLERYLETRPNDDEYDLAEPKSPEELIDRFTADTLRGVAYRGRMDG
jgi:hypothetical protein